MCLVLALASLIGGFVMLAVGAPETGIELHQARVSGDEAYRLILEDDLARRRTKRTAAIVALFVSTGIFTTAAFVTMHDPRRRR